MCGLTDASESAENISENVAALSPPRTAMIAPRFFMVIRARMIAENNIAAEDRVAVIFFINCKPRIKAHL